MASQRKQVATPVTSAPEGGSHAEGEMAEELLAVPGPSGVDMSAKESTPPVPAVNSAAAVGLPVEPGGERSPTPDIGQIAAVEPAVVELPGPAAESAAVVSAAESAAAEPAAAVGTVSEMLSGLASGPVAVEESAAGVLAGEPAAVEPVAATAAVSAEVPTATREGRPVPADGPVAAPKECWVINPGSTPKVIVRRIPSGSAAAAEAAASWEIRAGEPLPELGPTPAAGRAAAEIRTPPKAEVPRPAMPAAAASGKRKAGTGVAERSRKRKKSSPVKIKDF
jgi:hypothetical protein